MKGLWGLGNLKKIVMRFFDYIFYRTYKLFDRKGDDISIEKATNIMVVLLGFILIDIFVLIRRIFEFELNLKYFNKWAWGLLIALIIRIFMHMRYKKKFNFYYSIFNDWWGKEKEKSRIIKGWLIVLFIIVVVFTIPLTSIIK